MNKKQKQLLSFTCYAHAVSDSWHVLFPTLLFLITKDYENITILGFFNSIILIAAGRYGVLAGYLSDKYHSDKMISYFGIFSTIGCLIIFFSSNQTGLMLGLIIFGIGTGIYHPVGLALITRNIKKASNALGIHGMSGLLALGIIPITCITIGLEFGWKINFLLAAIVSFIVILTVPLIPRDFRNPNNSLNDNHLNINSFKKLLTQKHIIIIFTTSILRQFTLIAFGTFIAFGIATAGGIGENKLGIFSTTGILTTIVFLIGALGTYTGGKIGSKFSTEKTLTIYTLLLIPLLLLLGSFEKYSFIFIASLTALILSGIDPLLQSLIGKFTPSNMQGKAFAILYGIAQTIGSSSSYFSAIILSRFGLNYVFFTSAIFPLITVPLLIIGFWTNTKKSNNSNY